MALDTNLVAHYLLNNNADDSVGTFDGTDTGLPVYNGDSVRFDGINDSINTGYSVNLADGTDIAFTLSGWFERKGIAGLGNLNSGDQHPIFVVEDTGGTELSLSLFADMDTDNLIFQIASGTTANRIRDFAVSTVEDLSVGWHHYTVTYDGVDPFTGISIYLNGAKLTLNLIQDGTYTGMNTDFVVFGGSSLGNPDYLRRSNGNLSNSRFYSDEKDQTFIDELFAEGYYPPIANAILTLTATANASVSYGTDAFASFSLTATATPYVKGEADALFSLTATANAAAVIRGKADASFSLVGSAAATTYEALPINIGFRFVQEIEQSLIQIPFKFVQEIEQAVPTTIIQRVNV